MYKRGNVALKDLFETKSPFDELRQTVLAYVKQETLAPAKKLGRYFAFGVAGTISLSLGLIFLLTALLRLLQTQTGSTFDGHLSWIPYIIVVGAAFIVVIASLAAARRRASAKELIR